jgi:hypothetical protein
MQLRRSRPAKPKVTCLCEVCQLVPVTSGKVCTGCRVRKCRGAAIEGAACELCQIAQPRVLRWTRLADRQAVLCANHAALVGRRPIPWAQLAAEAAELEGALTPLPGAVSLKRAS